MADKKVTRDEFERMKYELFGTQMITLYFLNQMIQQAPDQSAAIDEVISRLLLLADRSNILGLPDHQQAQGKGVMKEVVFRMMSQLRLHHEAGPPMPTSQTRN